MLSTLKQILMTNRQSISHVAQKREDKGRLCLKYQIEIKKQDRRLLVWKYIQYSLVKLFINVVLRSV